MIPKDKRGGVFKPLGPMGKIQMSKGEPIKTINYLSCLTHPIIYYCQKLVELVIAWDGQGMTTQIRIEEAISFWETCFDSGKKKPKNVGHSTMLFMFTSPFFLHVELLEETGTSCVYPFPFFVVYLIFLTLGNRFW